VPFALPRCYAYAVRMERRIACPRHAVVGFLQLWCSATSPASACGLHPRRSGL